MNKFKKACEMSLNEWLATIPDDVPEAEYTENHEKWLKRLFNKMRDNRYHRLTTKTVKVLLVAAVLFALLLTAFVIPSSREFIIDNFDIYGTYKFTKHNNNSVNGEIKVGYIPEGFEFEYSVSEHKHIFNHYISKDENKFFTISKRSSSNKVDFNTEIIETENIVINNIMYIYSLNENNTSSVIWNENDYIYRINGHLSKEEIIKIAENVE